MKNRLYLLSILIGILTLLLSSTVLALDEQEQEKSYLLNKPQFPMAVLEDSKPTTRWSLGYGLPWDISKATKLSLVELNFQKAFSVSYQYLWWGLQAQYLNARYSLLANEKSSGPEHNDFNQISQLVGVGLGHPFRNVQNLFASPRWNEMVMVYVNYSLHQDAFGPTDYRGFGWQATYSLDYQMSGSFFMGFKLNYGHLYLEKTDPLDGEGLPSRSLVLGINSWGFELGYYF